MSRPNPHQGFVAPTMSRREFVRLTALATGVAALAACAPAPAAAPTEAPAATTAPAAGGQAGSLTLWSWEGMTDGLSTQVAKFNEKYPDVKFETQFYGYDDVHTNLLNAIVAGTGAPDLVVFDTFHLSEYADGLADLTTEVSPIADQFIKPSTAVTSLKGKHYGLPTDLQPIGLYYRNDLWEKAGLKETDFETWPDLAGLSSKYDAAVGGQGHLFLVSSNDAALFEILAIEAGFRGYYFNDDDTKVIVDDPKMVEAITEMKALWDAKGTLQNPQGGYAGDESTALFKKDQLATQLVGAAWLPHSYPNSMPELAGKWRITKSPAIVKGGLRGGFQYPSMFAIPSQSKMKEQAWYLLFLATTGDGARAFRDKSKVLCPFKEVYDETLHQPEDYFGGQKIYEVFADISKDLPDIFYGTGFSEAQLIVSSHLAGIMTGETTPADGLAAAAKEMRSKLNKG